MPSEQRIVAYLDNDDWELWEKALEKYNLGESKLLKEIVHAWLFSNKLQLLDK
ncbi:MAG: hypothetical protein KKD18_03430 [Nanoarchaeota archaeon]|nr:hypothetical protein [Nanoarchaeota archaeon]MBU0977442.1 hypothetical protein [Nanoarchaeota archaeon]